jgi:hypothetical protein
LLGAKEASGSGTKNMVSTYTLTDICHDSLLSPLQRNQVPFLIEGSNQHYFHRISFGMIRDPLRCQLCLHQPTTSKPVISHLEDINGLYTPPHQSK